MDFQGTTGTYIFLLLFQTTHIQRGAIHSGLLQDLQGVLLQGVCFLFHFLSSDGSCQIRAKTLP